MPGTSNSGARHAISTAAAAADNGHHAAKRHTAP
jgi:hypothetical protein